MRDIQPVPDVALPDLAADDSSERGLTPSPGDCFFECVEFSAHEGEHTKAFVGESTNTFAETQTKFFVNIPGMNNTYGDRLRLALERAGKTQSELARALDVKPQAIQYLCSPKARGSRYTAAIAKELGVNATWLASGQGEMEAAKQTSALTEPPKSGEVEEAPRTHVPAAPPPAARADVIDVPVMNAEGSMGYGRLVPEQEAIIDYMRLSLSFLRRRYSITNPANLRIVIGYGDSMAPTIKNGDPVLVDVGVTDLKIDGVYVLSRGDELFIKRMQRLVGGGFEMISDNQLYKPQVIEDLEADGLVVRGRALLAWNGRDL